MHRQITEFLRICRASEAIVNGENDESELAFSIDGVGVTLVRLSPASYLFEVKLGDLPVPYSECSLVLSKLLEQATVGTYASDVILCLSDDRDGRVLLLQKALSPRLKTGLEVAHVLMGLLEDYSWWVSNLDSSIRRITGNPDRRVSGGSGVSNSSPRSLPPVIFG